MSARAPRAGRSWPPLEVLLPCVIVLGASVLVTWPQGRHLSTTFAAHVDAYFSTWRLMWSAHALGSDPAHLFDANIFHPERGTLAYSDATLLQSMIAAPFLMGGASPILVYNLLLLTGFAGSGLAMYVLVRRLTGRTAPALVGALVFTMAPYRIEHFMHLEMQWTMWMPLTYWALHRTVEERSWRFGIFSGLFVWLQFLSCVYYGVFLSITVTIFVVLLAVRSPGPVVRALPALVAGGLVGAALTVPYALPYLVNARSLGGREIDEVLLYSAQPANYLAAPADNWIWGWTADRWGASERRLLPGLGAVLLASWALRPRVLRDSWIYVVLALVAFELSLGLNGTAYAWLFQHVDGMRGLRAPARFAILAQCGIAVLAGFGMSALQELAGRRRFVMLAAPAVIMALLAAEYANRPLRLEAVRPPDPATPDVYRMIRTVGPGVVVELPMPVPSALPGHDAQYAFWSASHWNPLVNGYSGYYPHVYLETLARMETFPDEESIQRLERLDVRFVVVHHAFYQDERRGRLLAAMSQEARLEWLGTFPDPVGTASLFALRR